MSNVRDGHVPSSRVERPSDHAEQILACDFPAVDTVWLAGSTPFFIEVGSPRIHPHGCTGQPTDASVAQQARNLCQASRRFAVLRHQKTDEEAAANGAMSMSNGPATSVSSQVPPPSCDWAREYVVSRAATYAVSLRKS